MPFQIAVTPPQSFNVQAQENIAQQNAANKVSNQGASNESQIVSSNTTVSSDNSALATKNEKNNFLQPPSVNQIPKAFNVECLQKSQSNEDLMKTLGSKGNRCSQLFESARTGAKTPDHIKQMLTEINKVYDNGTLFRNGKKLDKSEFTREMFHTAVLSGAHIVVQDNGAMTKALTVEDNQNDNGWINYAKQGGKQCYDGKFYSRDGLLGSSHYGGAKGQWGADVGHALKDKGFAPKDQRWMGHLLVGTTPKGHSFFQFENNGTSNSTDRWWNHGSDVKEHYFSKQQVGPQGKVDASEKAGKENHFVVIQQSSFHVSANDGNNNNYDIDADDDDLSDDDVQQVDANNNDVPDAPKPNAEQEKVVTEFDGLTLD